MPSRHSIILGLGLALLQACSDRRADPLKLEVPADVPSGVLEQSLNYPIGPWWLSPREQEDVRLAARHILISHSGAPASESWLGLVLHAASRSREDALRIAVALAVKAHAQPELFERLAQQYSDDRGTAAIGGDLGVFGPQSVPRALVDALGVLAPGETSRVVESEHGFHVLQRLALPEERRISASHLVIATDPARRSRLQAQDLAVGLSQQLRTHPERWNSLLEQHSDGGDASRNGDVGSWSTYEAGAPSALLALIGRLPERGISPAFESASGFEIVRHDAERARYEYMFTELAVSHTQAATPLFGAHLARDEAEQIAQTALRDLRRGLLLEQVVDRCKAQGCMSSPQVYIEGRADPVLEAALARTRDGAVVERVFETSVGFVLLRRDGVRPEPRAALKVRSELPGPPSMEEFVREKPAEVLVQATRGLGREIADTLAPEERPLVLSAFDQLAEGFAMARPEQRADQLRLARSQLRSAVGELRAAEIGVLVRSRLMQAEAAGSRQAGTR